MCLLVISNCNETLDPSRLISVSARINALIDHARVEQRPLAFLQSTHGTSFDGIGIRIGRYEPMFTVRDHGHALPSGLIDFIVGHAASQIQLAGVSALHQFERLGWVLHRSGFTTKIDAECVLFTDNACRHGVADGFNSHQLIENDPFTVSPFVRRASMKNQSTRWPSA